MTQENTPVSVEEKIQISSDSDKLLIYLIDTADKFAGQVDIDITLSVQGLSVSGVVISEKLYFEGIYNDLKLSFSSSDILEKEAQIFLENHQSFAAKLSGDREVKSQLKNIEYIHLKNVAFYNGNCLTPKNANNLLIPNHRGGYWRGHLNRVDGFCIGNLTEHK
ncbi:MULTISPECIES: hypothetical protein [unclassified Microcoleus]|uniref:hypothetical protein n=1 Tax=unclassified Microcoleus TaxID=2642155 RepID=UPI002FD04211